MAFQNASNIDARDATFITVIRDQVNFYHSTTQGAKENIILIVRSSLNCGQLPPISSSYLLLSKTPRITVAV
jgi:hypothetical protein